MTDLFSDDPHAVEVEQRLRELREDPEEALRRFDRNDDGTLDAEEWRVARDVVRREVEGESTTVRIADRYRIVAPIGRGAQGHTQLAVDETTNDFVAVKEVDFAELTGWDAVETFERESAVLGGLNHDAIPRVVDSFKLEEEGISRLFLVQTFIEGDNLEVALKRGTLFDEAKLVDYAAQLIDVLEYLHGHSPPVLHRDVKPANIIEQPDGSVALVDFGAAQGDGSQAAVIGTNGYMPAEQLLGRATPSSDLYALGATLIHLATRRHPSELSDGWKLQWRTYAKLSEPFADWLDQCTAPTPDDRFSSAIVASSALRRALSGGRAMVQRDVFGAWEERLAGRPPGGGPMVQRKDNRLRIATEVGLYVAVGRSLLIAEFIAICVFVAVQFNPPAWLALVGPLFAMILAYWLFRRQYVQEIEGSPSGLTLLKMDPPNENTEARMTEAVRLPLDDIAGPELLLGGHVVAIRMKSGKLRGLLGYFNANNAKWLRDELQIWLIERRHDQIEAALQLPSPGAPVADQSSESSSS